MAKKKSDPVDESVETEATVDDVLTDSSAEPTYPEECTDDVIPIANSFGALVLPEFEPEDIPQIETSDDESLPSDTSQMNFDFEDAEAADDEEPLNIADNPPDAFADTATPPPSVAEIPNAPSPKSRKTRTRKVTEDETKETEAPKTTRRSAHGATARIPTQRASPIVTIDVHDDIESEAEREAVIWHEIHNAFRTRRLLTGTLGGIEKLENGNMIVVVYYKNQRIVIPIDEMMIEIADTNGIKPEAIRSRQVRLLGNMLGAEIDFIVRGIDSKARSVVASRREAMIKKRRSFYSTADDSVAPLIHANRAAQARIIAVAEQAIRVEVFGVECSIRSGDLSWDWVGDAREIFSIGERVLVKVLEVHHGDGNSISIRADVKSLYTNTTREKLKDCRVQGKYAGKVIYVRKGVVFVRLSTGVSAIAHSCLDRRTPGKRDDVSFVVTHIDNERDVAVGIITRILKQNI